MAHASLPDRLISSRISADSWGIAGPSPGLNKQQAGLNDEIKELKAVSNEYNDKIANDRFLVRDHNPPKMAPITSDWYNVLSECQMALIAAGCVPQIMGAKQDCSKLKSQIVQSPGKIKKVRAPAGWVGASRGGGSSLTAACRRRRSNCPTSRCLWTPNGPGWRSRRPALGSCSKSSTPFKKLRR